MNLDEYCEMTTDFDIFMKKKGFVRTEELAKKFGLKPVTVRGWITQGLLPEGSVIMCGNVHYIVEDIKKPTKDRSKRGSRKGKYSYDI